jgi:hypothetical protein
VEGDLPARGPHCSLELPAYIGSGARSRRTRPEPHWSSTFGKKFFFAPHPNILSNFFLWVSLCSDFGGGGGDLGVRISPGPLICTESVGAVGAL